MAAVVPRSWRGRRVFAQAAPARVRKALPPARQRPVAQERRHVLPNGMTLLARRDPGARLVAMRAAWAGGVRLEEDRTSGAAAMLARLLSRGCGKSAAEVASRLDELGGSLEGVVGRNSFGASAEWLSDSWRDGLELMADCLLAPRLDEVEVASVRRQLLGELAAQATRPGRRALQVFLRALYGGHPYHRDVLGTEQSLARLSRNALRELYQQRFPVSSLALAVVGDVDPDEVVALVSARFASAPRRVEICAGCDAAVVCWPAADRARGLRLPRRSGAGAPGGGVPWRHGGWPREAAAGGSGRRAGRAERAAVSQLRERRGLAYQVAVHVTEGLDPGYLAIHVACAPDKLDEVHAVIRQELERLLGDGLTEDEAQRARNYVIGAHDTAMQRRSAVAAAMAYHEVYGLPWQLWQEHAQKVASLDAPALLAVARAHLRWDLAATATVRPEAGSPEVSRRGQRGARRKASVPSGGELAQRPRARGRASVSRREMSRRGSKRAGRAPAASTWALGRGDVAASLVLIFPLLLVYQLAIVVVPSVVATDPISRALYTACQGRGLDICWCRR